MPEYNFDFSRKLDEQEVIDILSELRDGVDRMLTNSDVFDGRAMKELYHQIQYLVETAVFER